MTPEEQAKVDRKLKEVAEILYTNTPDEELVTFETIELSVREQLLKTVAPKIGDFFDLQQQEQIQEEVDGVVASLIFRILPRRLVFLLVVFYKQLFLSN